MVDSSARSDCSCIKMYKEREVFSKPLLPELRAVKSPLPSHTLHKNARSDSPFFVSLVPSSGICGRHQMLSYRHHYSWNSWSDGCEYPPRCMIPSLCSALLNADNFQSLAITLSYVMDFPSPVSHTTKSDTSVSAAILLARYTFMVLKWGLEKRLSSPMLPLLCANP